jgi:heme exporter protein D
MGGYGAFIWPSFAITAFVLIGLLVVSLRAARGREATLRMLEGNKDPDVRGRRP